MAKVWDKQKGESRDAYAAFLAYRDTPTAERSLLRAYITLKQPQNSPKEPPRHWKTWSSQWQWVSRSDAYDADLRRLDDAARSAARAKIMAFRYALDYERVKALDALTQYLIDMSQDPSNVWLKTTRILGTGDNARKEIEEKFNAPLFDQIRGGLMDIAKHKGELTQKTDLTTGGQPLTTFIGVDPEKV